MHLIDHQARSDALNMNHSVIVQAPAGSGKTELLCQRFLSSLLRVEQPEQVLAITFTRKAAGEMRERILRYLRGEKAYSDEIKILVAQVLEQDHARNWQLIQTPQRLQIMTIDSLCASIVQRTPLESELGFFNLSDHPSELYRITVEQLLADADQKNPWQAALHQLLLRCDNHWPRLEHLLVGMLAKREQWLLLLPEINQSQVWRSQLEKNLSACVLDAVRQAAQAIQPEFRSELLRLMQYSASYLENPAWQCWSEFVVWPEDGAEPLEALRVRWQALAQFLLTKEGKLRVQVDKRLGFPIDSKDKEEKAYQRTQKEALQQLLAKFATQAEVTMALQQLLYAPMPSYTESQWQSCLVILQVLQALLAYWHLTITRHKKMDFTEVALRALAALGSAEVPTDLALLFDYRWQHILVDEFQDTSLLQYRLLEKLTQGWQVGDGRSLFFVGDPQQSIYRFRQAEVGLFLKTWQQGFEQIPLETIALTQNFRSQANLIAWQNEVLAKILPSISNMQEGAVAYTPVAAIKEPSFAPAVQIHQETDEQTLLDNLLVTIKAYQAQELSVAILVRSRNHLKTILPALHQANIVYQARDLTRLGEQPVIVDLLSLLKALLKLHDRLAWLSVLNFPWLRIELLSIQILFERDKRVVWQRLQDFALEPIEQALLSDFQTQAILKFLQIWDPILLLRQRVPLNQLLRKLWYELGAETYWSDAISLQAIEQFWLLLQSFEEANDLPDLALFEQHLMELGFTPEMTADNPVEIMTIHKSKGLEFDVVLLPALDRSGQHDDAPLLIFDEVILPQGAYFILAPMKESSLHEEAIFDYLWQLHKAKMRQEQLRQLYVACTRAKQSLHLFVQLNTDAEGEIKKAAKGSFWESLSVN